MAEPKIPELRIGKDQDGCWTVALADQFGWITDTGEPLPADVVAGWTPLAPAPPAPSVEHDADADVLRALIRAALAIYFDADANDPNAGARALGDANRALATIRTIVEDDPSTVDSAAPDGWYPAAMREHDRANAAELDRNAAQQRAASWWEAAKTLNRWGTAHRELHRKALVEITNLTAVRDELAHQRDDHRTRAEAAEAKLREEQAASATMYGRVFVALGLSITGPWSGLADAAAKVRTERDEARAKLDQIRAVLAEDWGYSELGITDFMHDQVRRLGAIVFASPEEWQSTVDQARAEREAKHDG